MSDAAARDANVGGEILSACLDNLAMYARVVLCGSISEYLMDKRTGPANYTNLRSVNGSMNGFFVYNYIDRFEESADAFAEWIKAGKLKPVQDMAHQHQIASTVCQMDYFHGQ